MYAIYSTNPAGWLSDIEDGEAVFDEYANSEYVFDRDSDAQALIDDYDIDAEVVEVTQDELDALENAFWNEDEDPLYKSLTYGVAVEQGSRDAAQREQDLVDTINHLYGKSVKVTPSDTALLRAVGTHAFSLYNRLPVTYERPVAGKRQGMLPNYIWVSLDGVTNVYVTYGMFEQANQAIEAILSLVFGQTGATPVVRYFIGLHDDVTEPPVDAMVTVLKPTKGDILAGEQLFEQATETPVLTGERRYMDNLNTWLNA